MISPAECTPWSQAWETKYPSKQHPPFKHRLIVKPLTQILSGHMINCQLEGSSNICHAHYRAQEVGALTLEASI